MARGEVTGRKPHGSAERRAKKPSLRGPPVERMAYTIQEFCAAHGISIDTYFRMAKAGTGPAVMKLAQGTRISVEAAAAWREAREAAGEERRREREAASSQTNA